MATKKPPRPPAYSQPATEEVADAIAELIEAKKARVELAERFQRLQQTIIAGRGGVAHGMRASIRSAGAGYYIRRIHVKARTFVVLTPVGEPK